MDLSKLKDEQVYCTYLAWLGSIQGEQMYTKCNYYIICSQSH